jgi:hypothetical protein
MSAFNMLAQKDLKALGHFTQPSSGDALAPTVVLVDGMDPFETYLALVRMHSDELRHSSNVNVKCLAIKPQVMALGNALHRLALVALNKLLSLWDEAALGIIEALQSVS